MTISRNRERPYAPNHQQIGIGVGGRRQQGVGHGDVDTALVGRGHPHTVPGQVGGDIGPGQIGPRAAQARRLGADHRHLHLVGPAQQGQGITDRPGRFAAAIPADDHPMPHRTPLPGIGQRQHRTPGHDRGLAGQIGRHQVGGPIRLDLAQHQQIGIARLLGDDLHGAAVNAQILHRAPFGAERLMRHLGLKDRRQPGVTGLPGLAVAIQRLRRQVFGMSGQRLGHRQAGQVGLMGACQGRRGGDVIGLVAVLVQIKQDRANHDPLSLGQLLSGTG